ncbi:hypothetical protein J2Z44_003235 [Clostridium punense]|uniref:Uncharacterized protein n=1 Tax=Clostridium punense TaxID=1054297 RepID=A0ABS4K6I0_9CLOT|nr:hypothetical protein M918_18450 [Clostridium sp. BL8]MBP2023398.1 hypothetical protein [Clostridium punense]
MADVEFYGTVSSFFMYIKELYLVYRFSASC